MTRIFLGALSLVLFNTGCTVVAGAVLVGEALDRDDDYDDYGYVDTGWAADGYRSEQVTGTMRGSLPAPGAFDAEIAHGTIGRSSWGTDLDLHMLDGRWAMIGGGFDVQLQDGETVVLGPDEHWVIGCGGPAEYDFEFDQSADTVTVTQHDIEVDGQAMIELTITATWAEGGEVTAVAVSPVSNPAD